MQVGSAQAVTAGRRDTIFLEIKPSADKALNKKQLTFLNNSRNIKAHAADVSALPVPQISGDKAIYCEDDIATLSANVPLSPLYTINWYLDGSLITADRNLISIQTDGAGTYMVIVTSTSTTDSQTSQDFPLTFRPAPVISKNIPDVITNCSALQLGITHTGPFPYSFRWYTNGVLNGDVSDSFLVTVSGKYRVEASTCPGSWVSSKEIQVNIINIPTPIVTADKQTYCVGDNATLTENVSSDASYSIDWAAGGSVLPQYHNLTKITTNASGDYTATVTSNNLNSNNDYCNEVSSTKTITFNPPPTLTIQKSVQTNLCAGQTANLTAAYTGGSILWSTGETTSQITVSATGTYTATVTSAAGCVASISTNISVFPNPVLNIADTSLCSFKGQTVTLTAPPGLLLYVWNGIPGTQTYKVTRPGIVRLTVTDANGCQASQEINVADDCAQIGIPNAFTPNSDGINDFWDIAGLKNDQNVLVKIFTRYGNQIFESKGYSTPWNGEYKGKKLPTGAYYYVITIKGSTKVYSGWVAIIY